ncbi:MAG: ABC transporter ATP-binding protein [Thermoanaerobacteraceae bacterium]
MLSLIDVESSYGYVKALKGVTIEIKEGDIVAILGANGAGKTTMLRTISGLLKPSRGKIEFMGERIDGKSPEVIVSKGIVQSPEGRQIFPNLSVLENLKIGAYTRKDKNNILKDLERIYQYFPRLRERQNQISGTLSGGEQQMLAIARALMAKPKLLMLDEPSLGLAPLIVKEIFEFIKEINQEGVTVLLVEQNTRQALAIANYAYILQTGSVVMEGKAEDLKNNEEVKVTYLGGKS